MCASASPISSRLSSRTSVFSVRALFMAMLPKFSVENFWQLSTNVSGPLKNDYGICIRISLSKSIGQLKVVF